MIGRTFALWTLWHAFRRRHENPPRRGFGYHGDHAPFPLNHPVFDSSWRAQWGPPPRQMPGAAVFHVFTSQSVAGEYAVGPPLK